MMNGRPSRHSLGVVAHAPAFEPSTPPMPEVRAVGPALPAFADIFRDHARFVWRALLGLGVGPSDVKDASQQVFLVLHKRLSSFDGKSTVRTFLYGICLRVASEHRRRAYRRYESPFAAVPESGAAATQEACVARRETLEQFQAALDRLQPLHREVFVLYEIEELSMAEIAQAMECPLPTAYSRLRAARKALVDDLGSAWLVDETTQLVGRSP
jgi:RNA polymerase sigma-70 factor, ECF subfamily